MRYTPVFVYGDDGLYICSDKTYTDSIEKGCPYKDAVVCLQPEKCENDETPFWKTNCIYECPKKVDDCDCPMSALPCSNNNIGYVNKDEKSYDNECVCNACPPLMMCSCELQPNVICPDGSTPYARVQITVIATRVLIKRIHRGC